MANPLIQKFFEKSKSPLYLNSIYLILTTGIMAGFGFLFWLINAKIFLESDVGMATAIIPTVTVIAIFSLVGFDNSVVKFLHRANDQGAFVRSTFLISTVLSIVCSLLFAYSSRFFSEQIHLFFADSINLLVFLFLTITTSLNQLCDSIFLAKKNTLLTLYTTALYTIIKVALPLIFFDLGALGILLAVSVAQLIGLFVNLYFLQRKWQYFSHVTISLQSATSIWKFTFHNYLAGILSLLPYAIVPIIIINKIGVHEVAYYYIVAMIANLMYTISGATTKSLFTEGVHNHEILHEIVKKSFYFISLLLLPAILVIFIIGKFLLGFFGPEYATNGLLILKILALSTIPYSLHSIFVSIFKIKNMSWALLISTAVLSLSEVVLAYYLAVYGLTGIGMATFLSMLLASIVSFGFILNLKFSDK